MQETFYLNTLGCRVNQYESQALTESLQKQGLLPVQDPGQANYIYINSCAVTARAIRDLNRLIRSVRAKSPRAWIIVTGCAAQFLGRELDRPKEVDFILPQAQKKHLLANILPRNLDQDSFGDQDYRITDYFRSRPVIKVQDGCIRGCSYCIVPRTRGASKSRSPDEILEEIQGLLAKGFAEVVLSGINLGLYGREWETNPDFWDLIRYLEHNLAPAWAGKARIRLSSLDPAQLDSKALNTIADSRMLCPHFHLAVQSGSPKILKQMHRGYYHPGDITWFVHELQKIYSLFALGADFLVGFPGEGPEEFLATRELVQALPLSYAHVFTYSPRPGTPAAKYPQKVPEKEKKRRSAEIKELVQAKTRAFASRLQQQKELDLVMEKPGRGMSEYFFECHIQEGIQESLPASMVKSRPLKLEGSKLWVEVIGSGC